MLDTLAESKFGQQSAHDAIPDIFCWTKMGTEAGQTLDTILRRKELERRAGNGVFAWGIGNSLGGNVALARQMTPSGKVDVIFTPMKSAAKQVDVTPSQTVLWLSYIESNGSVVELPKHLLITSRGGASKRMHYALLCHSETSLHPDEFDNYIYATCARNLASSNPIGASQVTSMVRYGSDESETPNEAPYKVAFRAALHEQGFLRLVNPVPLEGPIAKLYNQACSVATVAEWVTLAAQVRTMAQKLAEPTHGEDLFSMAL